MAPSPTADTIARVEARVRLDPDFADLLADLVDAPTGSAGEYTRGATALLADQRRRDAVEEFRAGALTTFEVQGLLGLGTPQAVHRLRSRGKLVGRPLGNHTWFPTWQFTDGGLRPDLARILELLGSFSSDVVATDRVMRLKRDDLDGLSIDAALDRADQADAAWSALAELGS